HRAGRRGVVAVDNLGGGDAQRLVDDARVVEGQRGCGGAQEKQKCHNSGRAAQNCRFSFHIRPPLLVLVLSGSYSVFSSSIKISEGQPPSSAPRKQASRRFTGKIIKISCPHRAVLSQAVCLPPETVKYRLKKSGRFGLFHQSARSACEKPRRVCPAGQSVLL